MYYERNRWLNFKTSILDNITVTKAMNTKGHGSLMRSQVSMPKIQSKDSLKIPNKEMMFKNELKLVKPLALEEIVPQALGSVKKQKKKAESL